MKIVGFIFNESIVHWNGGINYYRNLFKILENSKRYKILLFVSPKIKEKIQKEYKNIKIIESKLFSLTSLNNMLLRSCLYFFGKSIFVERLLAKYDIDILSHFDVYFLNKLSKIPSCGWITDFQAFRHPEYFNNVKNAMKHMKVYFKRIINNSTIIFVSSFVARDDLLYYFPNTDVKKIKVLQFVTEKEGESSKMFSSMINSDVLNRIGVQEKKYFVVCNQIYAYKNHIIVLKALQKLVVINNNKIPFKIVFTGALYDSRDSNIQNVLNDYITEHKLENYISFSGVLEYTDVLLLQDKSIAVIQPSFFEGWNTGVEECKNIGKKIILSDIPVHREQNPDNVVFFNPNDSDELANILMDIFNNYNYTEEEKNRLHAQKLYDNRWGKFSNDYLSVLDSLKTF